jgi:hypothetical protein
MDMKLQVIDPPRAFKVGLGKIIELKDCAHINLNENEQITLKTEAGAEYDVTRKSWGFYATPSLNGRLQRFNLRGGLIRNRLGQYYVVLVEKGKESAFEEYLQIESLDIITWLDNNESLNRIDALKQT